MMGALDCVSGKITLTESTEVITAPTSSNTTLNVTRRDLEAQSLDNNTRVKSNRIWWTLGLDVPLFLIVLLLIGLFEQGVIPSHRSGFFCNDPALSYPYTGDTVNNEILMSTLFAIPLIAFLVTEYIFIDKELSGRTRLISTAKNTAWLYRSYVYGLLFNLAVVEVMKGIMGGLRPTFFALCEPDAAKTCNGSEYVSKFECTSTTYSPWYQLDSYRSFPSGHTSLSVHCGLFVAWYLQRRAFDWRHRSVFAVPALQMLCAAYAAVCSLTRITDRRHHWWDVLVGAALGVASTLYATAVISNNFSYVITKSSFDTKSDHSQRTSKTFIYEEQRR